MRLMASARLSLSVLLCLLFAVQAQVEERGSCTVEEDNGAFATQWSCGESSLEEAEVETSTCECVAASSNGLYCHEYYCTDNEEMLVCNDDDGGCFNIASVEASLFFCLVPHDSGKFCASYRGVENQQDSIEVGKEYERLYCSTVRTSANGEVYCAETRRRARHFRTGYTTDEKESTTCSTVTEGANNTFCSEWTTYETERTISDTCILGSVALSTDDLGGHAPASAISLGDTVVSGDGRPSTVSSFLHRGPVAGGGGFFVGIHVEGHTEGTGEGALVVSESHMVRAKREGFITAGEVVTGMVLDGVAGRELVVERVEWVWVPEGTMVYAPRPDAGTFATRSGIVVSAYVRARPWVTHDVAHAFTMPMALLPAGDGEVHYYAKWALGALEAVEAVARLLVQPART